MISNGRTKTLTARVCECYTIATPVTVEEAGLVEPGAAVLAGLPVDEQQLCLKKSIFVSFFPRAVLTFRLVRYFKLPLKSNWKYVVFAETI